MFYFALTVTKSSKDHTRILASQPASYPANIRLDEDVLKTSFVFVFKTNMFALALLLQKTSSRRLGQDQYIRLGYTSSRRLQDVFKTSSRRLAKTSSRHLQDVLQRYLQDVFKAYHQVKLFA